jgi:hypothetical protein
MPRLPSEADLGSASAPWVAAQVAEKTMTLYDRRALLEMVIEAERTPKALLYYVLTEEHGHTTEYAQSLVHIADDFLAELRKRLFN